jgi:predicted DNA-binding transcriptional regulator YafY
VVVGRAGGGGGSRDRAERLDALIAEIRAQEGVSMQELADRLGVHVRTIRRDVRALRARGIDIEADRGRGGGIRFARSAPLPPLRLDVQQAVALWLAVEIARGVSGLPFSQGGRTGLNKVFGALPPERRAQLRQLCRRIVIGAPASDAMRESVGEMTPVLLDAFERCFREGACMGFGYVDRHGTRSQRRIEPHGIFVRLPFWYVLAVDVDLEGPDSTRRMFRMDRIDNPRLLRRSFTPSREVIDDLLEGVPYAVLDASAGRGVSAEGARTHHEGRG